MMDVLRGTPYASPHRLAANFPASLSIQGLRRASMEAPVFSSFIFGWEHAAQCGLIVKFDVAAGGRRVAYYMTIISGGDQAYLHTDADAKPSEAPYHARTNMKS